ESRNLKRDSIPFADRLEDICELTSMMSILDVAWFEVNAVGELCDDTCNALIEVFSGDYHFIEEIETYMNFKPDDAENGDAVDDSDSYDEIDIKSIIQEKINQVADAYKKHEERELNEELNYCRRNLIPDGDALTKIIRYSAAIDR